MNKNNSLTFVNAIEIPSRHQLSFAGTFQTQARLVDVIFSTLPRHAPISPEGRATDPDSERHDRDEKWQK
jgi:hypothetical protein